MTPKQTGEQDHEQRQPLRLWPGLVAASLQLLIWLGVPIVAPEARVVGMIGGFAGALAVLVWWLFFSRAPWLERIGVIALMIVGAAATRPILHPSIATGMMGMMFWVYAIPTLSLALAAWAAATHRLWKSARLAALVLTIVAACGMWTLLRTDGITGEGTSQFAWRWTKTSEQRLLAQAVTEPVPPPAPAQAAPAREGTPKQPAPQPAAEPSAHDTAVRTPVPAAPPPATETAQTGADWPGFRGAHRDDSVTGVRIRTDWASSPPVQLWRRQVGPGWSSFAVHAGLVYTQEQRGEFEVVTCYAAATGEPVWSHRDTARFWESNAGAGPRGTPALHEGRLYTFGATGIVNALDARTGAVVWTRNAAADTGAKLPGWGFSSSPLVVDDRVIIAASGRLAAYDLATGRVRWTAQGGGGSYSSPQLLTIGGVAQVVLLTGAGAISVAPADGSVLWKHPWPGTPILQPAMTADGGLLIVTGDMAGGVGTRRLAVAHGTDGWKAEEVWTSTGLKPYFNDIVVHNGNAYGFDGGILACIGLQDGKRKWKGGRYGHGQMLLLADQDLLLVLSEEGELALVAADPGQFTEIARAPAMDGKTWNHPVVAGDLLLVRNGQEMVAFRLPLAGS